MQENIKGIMVRVPESIHHKLKILAAMHKKSMTDVIIELVEGATIEGMEDIPAIKSLLYGAVGARSGQTKEPKPGASKKLKKTTEERKKGAKFPLD